MIIHKYSWKLPSNLLFYFYLVILVAASLVSADRLENVYLPPNARGANAGGANAGLQTPLGPGQQQQNFGGQRSSAISGSHNSNSDSNNAEILKYENEITEDGYHYAYETSDGTKVEQQGRVVPGATPEEGSLQVSGSYSYIGDDGQTYTVTYTADENGYRAEGAHLPTPPPIPEAILKSLQLTDRSRSNQYDSQKSSYDADAGYAK